MIQNAQIGVKMIVLNIIILIIYIALWFLSKGYEKEFIKELDANQYKLKQVYPMTLFLMDKISQNSLLIKFKIPKRTLDDSLQSLYVGEKLELVKRIYQCNKGALVIFIIFVTNLLSLVSSINALGSNQLIEGAYVKRPHYSEGAKKVDLDVNISESNSTLLEEKLQIEVEEQIYAGEELKDMFLSARKYIDSAILNKNESSEKVGTNLNFVSSIPNTGMKVSWSTDNLDILDEKGVVHNEEMTADVLVSITAKISYYDKKEEYTQYVNIIPKTYSKEELARIKLTEALAAQEEKSKTEERFILPVTLGDLKISWAEKKDNSGSILLLLGCLAALVLYIAMDKELTSKVDKRNREMLLDYPEIINKFTLLIGAGMPLSNAWGKISIDYKEKGVKRYAYEEMTITYNELKLGISETVAYERFGRRAKLIPYLRFSSLIAQNVKKGSVGLLEQLELEAVEAFEERKELAKRLGEEAGTKLLGPMMLMLLIVLAIIMVPVFLSFGI